MFEIDENFLILLLMVQRVLSKDAVAQAIRKTKKKTNKYYFSTFPFIIIVI